MQGFVASSWLTALDHHPSDLNKRSHVTPGEGWFLREELGGDLRSLLFRWIHGNKTHLLDGERWGFRCVLSLSLEPAVK